MAYTKLTGGTPFASDFYSTASNAAKIADGDRTTPWESATTYATTANSYIGYSFTTAVQLNQIEIDIYRWGTKLIIGYADTLPANKSGFTVLRTINTVSTTKDDLGVAWGSNRSGKRTNFINLDGNTVKAKYWAILGADNSPGPLSDGTTQNTRAGIYEMALYTGDGAVDPGTPGDGYTKVSGTAFASDVYSASSVAYLNDGSKTTAWEGAQTHESTANSFCGIGFSTAVSLGKLELDIYRWGSKIAIGYSNGNAAPLKVADLTVVRTIDVVANTYDDANVLWGSNRIGKATNTIILTNMPAAKYWAVINLDNQPSRLSDGTSSNSRVGMYEMTTYTGTGQVIPPVTYTEEVGTAAVSSQYNDFGLANALNDNNNATGWSSGRTGTTAANADFAVLQFSRPVKIRKVLLRIYSWGPTIILGYANGTLPTDRADFIPLRTIDVRTAPNDDLGVPWARQTDNYVLLPADVPLMSMLAVWTDSSVNSVLSASSGAMDRMRIMEFHAYTASDSVANHTIVSQNAEMFLVKEPDISITRVSQSSEMLLIKDGIPDTRASQTSEMLLIKDSEAIDLQVSHMNVTFVVDAEDPSTATSQNAEMMLLKDTNAESRITRSAEMIFMRSQKANINTTRNAQLFFISEMPSVFFLDFGVLENPDKNALYTSVIKIARSVPDDAFIQLEGLLAPDSVIYVNGENMGKSAPVKTGDEVYLVAGVPNYWTDKINLYSYTVVNGQIAREVVGLWTVTHVPLSPIVARSYDELSSHTWEFIQHHSETVERGPSMLFAKAKSMLVSLQAIFAAMHTRLAKSAGIVVPRSYSEMYRIDDFTNNRAYSEQYTLKDFINNRAYSELYFEDSFTDAHTYGAFYTLKDFTDAHTYAAMYELKDFTDAHTYAAYHFNNTYEQTQASDSPFKLEPIEVTHSHIYMRAAEYERSFVSMYFNGQDFELFNTNKPGAFGTSYEPVKFTRQSALFSMQAIGTIAYSSFYTGEYQYGSPTGYSFWKIPTKDAEIAPAKMNLQSFTGFEFSKAHPHLSASFENEIRHSPSQGEFAISGVIKLIAAISKVDFLPIKRVERTVPVQLGIVKRVEHVELVDFKPYRHEQNVNGIGPASLYMGFDSLGEVESFTGEFDNVIIETKFNGYVYKLEVDQTFVCAIYFNGPIKWLLQGG